MPVEWNSWVLFRHSVDIILLNDFLSYFFCGISFLTFPDPSDSKAVFMCVLRWVAGITLLVFNLWVKTDAHRIITDLAWYWADTFFTSMQDLVFDGVFEMAPHPLVLFTSFRCSKPVLTFSHHLSQHVLGRLCRLCK
jgi:phosphatidylethanolamine N-methyltransferase